MSGSHRSGSHRSDSGSYPAGSGGYRAGNSGGYRYVEDPRRTGSGSHRVVREERRSGRRWIFVFAGVVAGAGACVLAAFAIMTGLNAGERSSGGTVSSSGAADSTPMSNGERSVVPDACQLVGDDLAGKLAPNADRTQADNYQNSDTQNQCVWGAYTGSNKRQLTVELRAISGAQEQSATAAAKVAFSGEQKADESGKSLLGGQELTEKQRLSDVGDEGYVVYSVDKGQGSGEAIANVRVVNVLVTIHYSGANHGEPLDAGNAIKGAIDTAKSAVTGLSSS
ncbi:hypothetical protein J4573_34420 [Actinomadura barringtoniae]|uniref:DUF3558 domain-containing protein n=1 Tax=Actinomadura barringtoniae TaxID=1427535 RepID=A0A939T6Q2_9ACTN|nr:hypothetical protein [Actinomadura barringtoniae]MBO2452228.1 hypothetical protein [Actinomadura barringtoniae]